MRVAELEKSSGEKERTACSKVIYHFTRPPTCHHRGTIHPHNKPRARTPTPSDKSPRVLRNTSAGTAPSMHPSRWHLATAPAPEYILLPSQWCHHTPTPTGCIQKVSANNRKYPSLSPLFLILSFKLCHLDPEAALSLSLGHTNADFSSSTYSLPGVETS